MNTSRRDFIHLFTHHKVASNLLMVLILLAGVWGLKKLNTQFFPNFALDIVTVRVLWTGASADDVESAITIPLEQELRSVSNLRKLSSTSATSISAITLEFDEGTDMGSALDEINERIARIRNFPSTAEDPEVSQIVRYDSIARVVLTHDQGELRELRQLAYQYKDQLLDRGIAKIEISGLPEQEIAIQVPSVKLQELGMSLGEIGTRIRALSQDLPAGFVGNSDVARQLRSLQQQRSVTGFADLPVITDESGRRITVKDIAIIEQRSREGETHLFYNGKPAVELQLQRTEHTDALKAADVMKQWLVEIRPTLPNGVNLTVYDQSWILIKDRINLLLSNGIGGLLLVIVILFVFLNGRVAFWVMVGIPISFLATFAIMNLAGSSINMISLFGLIMTVGIIVDDAIVVAEHSTSRFQDGDDAAQAAENGARRMLAPVFSSSLTTIAAFLPLMLVGGIMGNIMFEIPLVVICVILASLFECFLILPAHMRMSFSAHTEQKNSALRDRFESGFANFREHKFTPFVSKVVQHRGITISTAIAVLIISIGLAAGGRIGFTFFPNIEGNILNANASFTAGTPRERVDQFLQHLNDTLRETEQDFGGNVVNMAVARQGVTASSDGTGQRRGEQYGSMTVEVLSPDEREFRNAEFLAKWQSKIQLPPGIELFSLAQRMGGPPGQDLDIRLKGSNAFNLKLAAGELLEKLKTYPGVSGAEDDLPWGQEQLIYELTPMGRSLGLSTDLIGSQLRTAYDGMLVQMFQDANDETEVRVILPDSERKSISGLETFNIKLPNGNFVPLRSVVTLKAQKGFEALRHSEGRLTVRVGADVERSQNNANRILADLDENFLPVLAQKYGLSWSFEGRAADQRETMADMKFGTLVAFSLIFIILAWVFASYSKPLVVMSAIPFGITGALMGHFVMGIDLTILSLFGIVGLSGIVVNNSIILVSVYQELREKNVPVPEAIVEATRLRLRAVLLTSLTTVAGLTPLLFETSLQAQFLIPMAVSITFGLVFSTMLVLIVLPAILSVAESATEKFTRRRKILLESP